MVRNNGDIRGFFGAKPSSSRPQTRADNQQQQQQQQQQPPSPPCPRTPPPSSRPAAGAAMAAAAAQPKRQFGLQDEIKESDEDDDSDASLQSLSAIIGRKAGPATYQRPSTPQAKRIASSSSSAAVGGGGLRHGSPLTLQQKQTHKFDLKALISHTRQSERTDEISRQAEELISKAEDSISSSSNGSDDSSESDVGGGGDDEDEASIDGASPSGRKKKKKKKKKKKTNLQQVAKELLEGEDGGNEDDAGANPKGGKIARALNRTQVQGRRLRCYFFDLDLPPLFKPAKTPFPVEAAVGPWKCLADPSTRDQAIINGLPHAIVAAAAGRRRRRELPEPLFEWLLDQVCVERDPRLRAQYCSLVAACRDCINNLVDGARLYGALERIGGPKYAEEEEEKRQNAKLRTTPEVEEPYRGRDWSGLAAFLDLLRQMAPSLDPIVVVDAVQLLLRMSLDPVVSAAVRREHLAALEALVAALPEVGATRQALPWDIACFGICSYVLRCTAADDPIQRLVPVASIPKSSAKLADLRRRLAAAVLFDDESFGCKPTDSTLDGGGADALLERLARPDFSVRPATDYEALRALVALLDIVVESGGFLRRRHDPDASADGDGEGVGGGRRGGGLQQDRDRDRDGDKDRDAEFDADIDALTFRLRALHDKIHDNGLLARKEAKAAIDVVGKRLTYAVRTRPPAKTSIFDPQPREDADLPKQRDFMKNWAQRRGAAGGAERVRSPAVA